MRLMMIVRCCSFIQVIRCCSARSSTAGAIGWPLRVIDMEMFLSGTQSAASAQPIWSRPVFSSRSNSSASLSAATRCDDISSIKRQIALAYAEIALARSELRAQPQLAAHALEHRLNELANVGHRARCGLHARESDREADDTEDFGLVAAHHE
jgi:hypothetical protein